MRELFFHILNGAAVRIGGAIKRIGSAPGAKYSLYYCFIKIHMHPPFSHTYYHLLLPYNHILAKLYVQKIAQRVYSFLIIIKQSNQL